MEPWDRNEEAINVWALVPGVGGRRPCRRRRPGHDKKLPVSTERTGRIRLGPRRRSPPSTVSAILRHHVVDLVLTFILQPETPPCRRPPHSCDLHLVASRQCQVSPSSLRPCSQLTSIAETSNHDCHPTSINGLTHYHFNQALSGPQQAHRPSSYTHTVSPCRHSCLVHCTMLTSNTDNTERRSPPTTSSQPTNPPNRTEPSMLSAAGRHTTSEEKTDMIKKNT